MLFNDIEILHTTKLSKKPVEIIVNINYKCTTLFMKSTTKTTIEGFIHPTTGFLVTDTYDRKDILAGVDQKSAHRKYMDLALDYAKLRTSEFLAEIFSLSADEYAERGYKTPSTLRLEIERALENDIKIEKNILNQLSVVRSKDMPEPNQFIVYKGEPVDHLVTDIIPYEKPAPERHHDIDDFLSVFFEDEDKEYFSWYMGAILHNKSMCDHTLQKMMVVTSAVSGVGKSSLVNGLVNHVFTPTFAKAMGEYDSFFATDSRFGTSSLPSTRLLVFNEAEWGKEKKDEHPHNFTGMNTSAIKSILTEGYLDEEPKYGTRQTVVKHSGQIVLSNYLPVLRTSDRALERRILPVIVRPTLMVDKVEQLGLFGQAFDDYIKDNAEKFCAYFLKVYMDNPQLVMNFIYNYKTYDKILSGERDENSAYEFSVENKLRSKNNITEVLHHIRDEYHVDTPKLESAIEEHLEDDTKHTDLVRFADNTLWLNSSTPVLSKYTTTPDKLKEYLGIKYGATYKKYSTRRYLVPYMKEGTA